ncbi:MAG: OmpA family protein [Mariprofundaceae bacterium]|nr:OmpA family protein [Mariprofundaceae bacterium]
MRLILRSLLGFFCVVACATWAWADALQDLNHKVETFKHSEQARFVPDGLKRLSSYQGAMMLAVEQDAAGFSEVDNTDAKPSLAVQQAMLKVGHVLQEVQNNALVFSSTFADLLHSESQANKAYVYHHVPQTMPNADVVSAYETASQYLQTTIENTELGQLNQARQAARQAEKFFSQSIDAAMSGLVEQTSRAVSQAASAGAKRYTPRLWAIVRAEFGLLKRYHKNQQADKDDKIIAERPDQPGYAFEMAVYTQKLALQVKHWRRDAGSHEKMALEARQHRLALAQAVDFPMDYAQVGVDIAASELVILIKAEHQTLLEERQNHEAAMQALRAEHVLALRDALYQQRLSDQQAFQLKVGNLKSAFKSKLEQETFEKKRRAKVRELFSEQEVDILANLDGSLLIRAQKIQFTSGSSKLGGQYFDFLGRVKEALLLYPERQIRIEGHTDNLGGAKENRSLSLKRAEAVQSFLIAADMDVQRLRALGYGDVKPIVSNDYKKGRAMNRRIDVIIEAAHE